MRKRVGESKRERVREMREREKGGGDREVEGELAVL